MTSSTYLIYKSSHLLIRALSSFCLAIWKMRVLIHFSYKYWMMLISFKLLTPISSILFRSMFYCSRGSWTENEKLNSQSFVLGRKRVFNCVFTKDVSVLMTLFSKNCYMSFEYRLWKRSNAFLLLALATASVKYLFCKFGTIWTLVEFWATLMSESSRSLEGTWQS